MFVKYNRPNNHVLSTYGKPQANGVLSMPEIKVLRPGWQEFPKAVFDEHLEDPEVKKMIAEGIIEISDLEVKQKVGKKMTTTALGKVDEEVHLVKIADDKKCIEIVNGTFNRELLQRWLDEENRSKVKRALEKRMKELYDKKEE